MNTRRHASQLHAACRRVAARARERGAEREERHAIPESNRSLQRVRVSDGEGRDVGVLHRHAVYFVISLRRDGDRLQISRALDLPPRVVLDAVA